MVSTTAGRQYGSFSAFVFVFNLVVGVGGLALPLAFSKTGLILGSIFVAIIAFFSYMTLTWVIEALGAANAVLYSQKRQAALLSDSPGASLLAANTSPFEITERTELGLLAEIFLGKRGRYFFYTVMIIYLYGDLAIYAASVPLTLQKFTGTFNVGSLEVSSPYHFYLFCFMLFVGPFCFLNFQGTAWFQYLTMAIRNSAFFTMIVLGLIRVAQGDGASVSDVKMFDISGVPNLFGTAVYAFMCHHSLPSIVTPIKKKSTLSLLFAGDYITVYVAYVALCISAVFAFGNVTNPTCESTPGPPCKLQDLYTLNFSSYSVRFLSGFLTLFPVFTLTTNFPLIAITLRNNIQTLYESLVQSPEDEQKASADAPFSWKRWFRKNIITFLVIIPPCGIAFITDEVSDLVSFTGAFAGLFIQYVIPASLVYQCRLDSRITDDFRRVKTYEGLVVINDDDLDKKLGENIHKSPFSHVYWVYLIYVWSGATFVMTVYNQIRKYS